MNRTVIALGFFDGVHLGHAALLNKTKERAAEIGAMPSVMNAIIDALDGTQLEMPATPEKIWRICQQLALPMAAE